MAEQLVTRGRRLAFARRLHRAAALIRAARIADAETLALRMSPARRELPDAEIGEAPAPEGGAS